MRHPLPGHRPGKYPRFAGGTARGEVGKRFRRYEYVAVPGLFQTVECPAAILPYFAGFVDFLDFLDAPDDLAETPWSDIEAGA